MVGVLDGGSVRQRRYVGHHSDPGAVRGPEPTQEAAGFRPITHDAGCHALGSAEQGGEEVHPHGLSAIPPLQVLLPNARSSPVRETTTPRGVRRWFVLGPCTRQLRPLSCANVICSCRRCAALIGISRPGDGLILGTTGLLKAPPEVNSDRRAMLEDHPATDGGFAHAFDLTWARSTVGVSLLRLVVVAVAAPDPVHVRQVLA